MRYYRNQFGKTVEAQNERYRKNRQHSRIRTTDDWYRDRVRQPEGLLLYIGDKSNRRDVPPDVLWTCAEKYIRWEQDYSKAHGGFYVPLSFALHFLGEYRALPYLRLTTIEQQLFCSAAHQQHLAIADAAVL